MLTRCPHCRTAFRVTPEQLKVHHGVVRCGTCREIFNALDSLTDEVAVVIAQQQPAVEAFHPTAGIPLTEAFLQPGIAIEPEAVLPEICITAPEPEPELESILEPEPESEVAALSSDAEVDFLLIPEEDDDASEESRRWQDGAAAGEDEVETELPPAVTVALALAPTVAVEPQETPLPEAWAHAAEVLPRRWPWRVGVLGLLILMLGQLLFVFRVDLAVSLPELRPAVMAACDLAGCALPHPRKLESLSIETSDLAPADGERLLLTATLKNRAPFDQECPHLELTLTDSRDAAMVRKVLTPADYLPAGQSAGDGFAARSEIAVKLNLEALGVPAVGYRLYLFYP